MTGVTQSLVSARFVGRRDELTRLDAALNRAAAGTSAAVLIGGEAGVGKSRLLRELTARASDEGVRVLAGYCVELSADGLPLAPLVDVLRALHRTLHSGATRRTPRRRCRELGPAVARTRPGGHARRFG